ncbi:MAG TPA: hypothetical protein VGE39_09740 [Prosthecobacter sp.]
MSLPIIIPNRAEQDMMLQYQWYLKHAGLDIAGRCLLAVDTAITELSFQPDLGVARRFQSDELQGIRSSQADGAFDKHLILSRNRYVEHRACDAWCPRSSTTPA